MKNVTTKQLTLKSYLYDLSQEELVQEVESLHKLFPMVKEYYKAKLSDSGEEELLKKYKKAIEKAFSINFSSNTGPFMAEGKFVCRYATKLASGIVTN